MGGSSSKVARKLPTKPNLNPPWSGARNNMPGELGRTPQASEIKDEAIRQDSMDPQFLAKLNRLGPVKVDHHMSTFRPDTQISKTIRLREASEREAASYSPERNHIHAGVFADLLERRKFVKTRKELEALARRYDMDVELVERVAKYVTTPSVDEMRAEKIIPEGRREEIVMEAVWIEPSIESDQTTSIQK